ELLVERLTQNHAQRLRLIREHGCRAQIECAVVAHQVAEIAGDRRRKIKVSRISRPRAVGLWMVPVPSAHLSPRPICTTRPGSAEDFRIQLSTARHLRRQMMGDASVGCLHAAQVSGDVRSYDEAGELPGKKIECD